jgi:ribosomal protein L2
MPVKTFRPLTPSTRYITIADFSDITKTKPEKSLVEIRKKTGGRNHYGRVTARGIGGGHKQKIRLVDFKRNKHGVEATVTAIEYDPMRSARLALLQYKDGEKRYIIAPVGIQVGRTVSSGPTAPPEVGNALPLKAIPVSSSIHNLELQPGRGGQIVRSAGGVATLMSIDDGFAQIRLPSGEIRKTAMRRLARWATRSMRTWFWAKPAARVIAGIAASRAAWRATRWITRTVAARASPRAVAAGSSWCRPGARWPRAAGPVRNTNTPTVSSWSAATDCRSRPSNILWDARLKKARS